MPARVCVCECLYVFVGKETGTYYSNGKLSNDRSNALLEWINLLHWTLPEDWGLHDTFLSDVRHNFDNLTQGKDLFLNEIDKHSSKFWFIYDMPGSTLEMTKKPKHELQKYSHGCNHGKVAAGMCLYFCKG